MGRQDIAAALQMCVQEYAREAISAQLQSENPSRAARDAAVKTLQGLGYTYHEGEQWKPPLGKPQAEPHPCEEAARADLLDELEDARLEADTHHTTVGAALAKAIDWIAGERDDPDRQPQAEPVAADDYPAALNHAAAAVHAAMRDPSYNELSSIEAARAYRGNMTNIARRAVNAWLKSAASLAVRPPVASPAPAARREPGWDGPMVNDATPQAEPVALLWQVMNALHLASAICDAVPSRDPGHLGKLVNAQDDGTHGYRVIHDAEKALAAYLTTPTTTPAQAEPVAADGFVLVPVPKPTADYLLDCADRIEAAEGREPVLIAPQVAEFIRCNLAPVQGAAETVELEAKRLWETIKILGLSNDRLALQAIRRSIAAPVVASQPVAQGLTDEQCDEIMTKTMHEKRGAAAYDFIRAGYAAALAAAAKEQSA